MSPLPKHINSFFDDDGCIIAGEQGPQYEELDFIVPDFYFTNIYFSFGYFKYYMNWNNRNHIIPKCIQNIPITKQKMGRYMDMGHYQRREV
jgi:hypothetical protein